MTAKTRIMRSDSQKRITVFGVGRLGLCFALKCEAAGYDVLGVDVVPSYVQSLNDKTFASDEPNVSAFLQKSTKFRATLSLDEGLAHSDLLFLLLATPTGIGEKSYDHSMLSRLLQQIVRCYLIRKSISFADLFRTTEKFPTSTLLLVALFFLDTLLALLDI